MLRVTVSVTNKKYRNFTCLFISTLNKKITLMQISVSRLPRSVANVTSDTRAAVDGVKERLESVINDPQSVPLSSAANAVYLQVHLKLKDEELRSLREVGLLYRASYRIQSNTTETSLAVELRHGSQPPRDPAEMYTNAPVVCLYNTLNDKVYNFYTIFVWQADDATAGFSGLNSLSQFQTSAYTTKWVQINCTLQSHKLTGGQSRVTYDQIVDTQWATDKEFRVFTVVFGHDKQIDPQETTPGQNYGLSNLLDIAKPVAINCLTF